MNGKSSRELLRNGLNIGIGIGAGLILVLTGALYAQSLLQFVPGQVVSASYINQNFTNLNNRVAPIGGIIAWHKSLGGVPTLPAGWVECNGQVVSDSASPMDGQTTPNLNGPPNAWNAGGYFLRGGAKSGNTQVDVFQGHRHWRNPARAAEVDMSGRPGILQMAPLGVFHPLSAFYTGDPVIGLNGTPRIGGETRPIAFQVVWIMRVQ